MTEHTKESGHFYRKDGTPAYTIIGKNGKERPTTLRDARKEGLLPSVTEIIKLAAAPGLERWKSEQILMAALTTDRLEGEPEDLYINRIIKDSQEQGKKAREKGTLIHAWVQDGFEHNLLGDEPFKYYLSALDVVEKECGEQPWICEASFATERYGGKIDLQCNGYIIDIKTTDKPVEKLKLWDTHEMQLAAYDTEHVKQCGILFINSTTAESKLVWATEEQLMRGWKCFQALTDLFYAKTNLGN